MLRKIALCAVLLGFTVFAAPAHADKKYHVLFQWTEADTIGQFVMTKHINNLLDDLGQDNVQLEVIAYGAAVTAIDKTNKACFHQKDFTQMTSRGVVFHACSHAMDFFGVKKENLVPEVTPVQGAMMYIVQKHADGWQILRP